MPKATTPTSARQGRRHNPLEDDIVATGILRSKPGKRRSKGNDDDDGDNFVDSRASKNILRIGRQLEEGENADKPKPPPPAADNFGYDSRFGDEDNEPEKLYGDEDEAWGDEDEEVEEIEVDPEDLETYKRFLPDEEDDLLKHGWDRRPTGDEEQGDSVNLADLILEKIAAHEAAESRGAAGAPDDDYELPPKVVEAYTK